MLTWKILFSCHFPVTANVGVKAAPKASALNELLGFYTSSANTASLKTMMARVARAKRKDVAPPPIIMAALKEMMPTPMLPIARRLPTAEARCEENAIQIVMAKEAKPRIEREVSAALLLKSAGNSPIRIISVKRPHKNAPGAASNR